MGLVAVVDCVTGEVNYENLPLGPSLYADRHQIIADDITASVISYINEHSNAPAQVTFDVNGTTSDVVVIDGKAEIQVTAANPGNIIVICENMSVTIEAVSP